MKTQPDKPSRTVVIGASAAGLKTVCRKGRLLPDADVTVADAEKYISYAASGLPYYLPGYIGDFTALIRTPYELVKDAGYYETVKGITIRNPVRAVRIDRDRREVRCEALDTGEAFTLPCDNLVIATGACPTVPHISGSDLPGVCTFTTAGDAIGLKQDCETGKIEKVALIGAGYIGIELCGAFTALWGIEVTLFEGGEYILPGLLDPEIAHHVEAMLREEDIDIRTGTPCTAISGNRCGLNVETARGKFATVFDRIVFSTGITPNGTLAQQAGLALGTTGGIAVNEYLPYFGSPHFCGRRLRGTAA